MRKTTLLFLLIVSGLLFCLLVTPMASTEDAGRFTPAASAPAPVSPNPPAADESPFAFPRGLESLATPAVSGKLSSPPAGPRAAGGASVAPAPLPLQTGGLNVCNGANCYTGFDDAPTGVDVRGRYQQIKFSSGVGGNVLTFASAPGTLARTLPHSISPQGNGKYDLYVDFPQPVNNVSFYITELDNVGYSARVQYFKNYSTTLAGAADIPGNGLTDKNPVPVTINDTHITKIKVVAIADDLGLGYDDFTFNLTPPDKPANLSTRAGVSPPNVELRWDVSTLATSYRVKRSGSAGGPYGVIATVPANQLPSYLDTNTEPGKRYFYVVSAVGAGGESPNSNEAQSTTSIARPVVAVTVDKEKVKLVWAKTPGVRKWVVKRSAVSGRDYETRIEVKFDPFAGSFAYTDQPPVNREFFYVVSAVGDFEVADSSEMRVFVEKNCGVTALSPVPPRQTLRYFDWTLDAEVTPRDGVVLHDVTLNGRYMAKLISLPYVEAVVFDGFTKTYKARIELTPNADTTRPFDPNHVQTRLVSLSTTTKYRDPKGREILGLRAVYMVDRLFEDSQSCLRIIQEYEFSFNEPGGCELSSTLPCTRVYPRVTWDFEGRASEKLVSINIPQRLHVRVDNYQKGGASLFRDCDALIPQLPLGAPCPTGGILGGFVFEYAANPLQAEALMPMVKNRLDFGLFDNLHQTHKYNLETLPFPASIAAAYRLLTGVFGGCAECFHMHWRWGKTGTTLFERPENPEFGGGNVYGVRKDLDLAVVRFRDVPDEIHPFDFKALVNFEPLSHKVSTVIPGVPTTRNPNPMPTVKTTNVPEDIVLWYSSTDDTPTGTTFGHGAFFNWDKGKIIASILPRPADTGAAGTAAATASSGDGPTSITYEHVYIEAPTTFVTLTPAEVGPLPRGFAQFNNVAYAVQTQAAISGQHVITFSVPSVADPDTFADLRVLRAEPDPFDPKRFVWVDSTILPPGTPAPDFASRTIRATVPDVGIFVIAQAVPAGSANSADIAVTATQSAASLRAGENLTYNLTVSNQGPQAATQVGVVSTLSPDVAFISVSPVTANCKFDHGSVYCKLGPLASGASAGVTLVVTPVERGGSSFPPEGRTIDFSAYAASAEETEPNESNNTARLSAKATPDPNARPTVRITAPANSANVTGPVNLTVTAEATDSDGSVAKVEFFGDGASIGVGQSVGDNQYGVTWSGVGFGPHTIVAVVTDSGGRQNASQVVSIAVNGPAAVSIVGPAPNSLFPPGSSLALTANATIPFGSITKVEFFADGTLIGQATPSAGGQYTFNWNGVPRGRYALVARATDDNGFISFSVPVVVTVSVPIGINISSPADGTSFLQLPEIALKADVSNEGVLPARVEFFANGMLIGTGSSDSTTQSTLNWLNVPDGIYSVVAVATDDFGARFTSAPVNLAVNTPGLSPGNLVWFDDAPPQGARTFSGRDDWYWDGSNPAAILGSKSHQSVIADGFHQHGFDGAAFKLPVNAGDRLFTYVFLHPGYMPQEIMLEWKDGSGWEHRAFWGAESQSRIRARTNNNDASSHYMGPLPPHSRWVKLEVPAEAVGLAGKLVDGMAFDLYGGRAAWDGSGKTTQAPQPEPAQADTVWFEETYPGTVRFGNEKDKWDWVPPPVAFSGLAHKTFQAPANDDDAETRYRAHWFSDASQTMTVNSGDVLFTYAYLPRQYAPDQLVVGWGDGNGFRYAYWGDSRRLMGDVGTEMMRYMGPLPDVDRWVRLEVPASYLGLEGKTLHAMYFGMNRQAKLGLVYWDRAGKSTLPLSTTIEPLHLTTPAYRFSNEYAYSYFVHPYWFNGLQPGPRWYAHNNRAPGTVPFYRYRHQSPPRQYLYITTPPDGQGSLPGSPGWKLDTEFGSSGIAFYIYPKEKPQPPGTVPLRRYTNHAGRYWYTIFPTEQPPTGYSFEAEAGYVAAGYPVFSSMNNPIDDPVFFVKQQYRDFLGREADPEGLNYWVGQITQCNDPAKRAPGESQEACVERKRVDVSGAFFDSIEFRNTGYLVYKLYRAALDRPAGLLGFDEFLADSAEIGDGVIVLSEGWQAKLDANKAAFLSRFVERGEFLSAYPEDMTPAQYVDKLYDSADVIPTEAERQAAVAEFAGAGTSGDRAARARVLRALAEGSALNDREVNRAFVLMQYFGYLRRHPTDPPDGDLKGYDHWLGKLEQFHGDWRAAEMVKAFISSIEYRNRFGQPVTAKTTSNIMAGASSAKAGSLTVTFAGGASPGTLDVKPVYPGYLAAAPTGYAFYDNLAWEVSATPSVSGPLTVKVSLDSIINDPAEFANLRLLHLEDGAWVDRTVLPADFEGRTISAGVNSLAPVAVARLSGDRPPSVSITSPAAGQGYTAPAAVTINAAASSDTAGVTRVEFWQGDTLLGEDTTAPYSFAWANVPAGNYALTARATDGRGVSSTSPVVNVTVNDLPAVFIASPAQNAVLDYPANVGVTAFAGDSNGVKQVEFFQGATSLGVDTTAPYGVTWSGPPVGTYTLTAVAKDNLNTAMTSPPVTFTVRNLPPTVAITAPASGTLAGNAPVNITVNATAQDSNGIGKVEFFQGATKLGEDATAPYSLAWNNVAAGTYSLTARATDGFGAVATSGAVSVTVGNAAPAVAITAPANGANLGNAPATINIQATATDNEGVGKVEFFQGATKLGEDTTAPYAFAWNNVAAGTYSLTAKATDTLGAATTSSPVGVTVSNAAPTVSITSPAAGTSFNAPASVAITAAAADHEGVKKVEFFQGATKLGEDLTAPYTFTWSNVAAGTYSLTARATDNLDAVTTSGAVSISVGGALYTLFSDDFNDNVIDPARWYVTEPLSASLVAERNQRLELTPATAASVTAYNGYASVPSVDMTNAQVTVEVTQYAPSYGHETYLTLRDSVTGNNLLFVTGGAGLVMQDSSTGSAGRTVLASYNTTQHRFWRLRHDPAADRILWETSGDGAVWVTQRSVTRPFSITTMQVQLMGGKYAGVASSPATSVLDNLKVLSAVANTQPSVSLTSPANGAVFNAPASATVTASASDSDGTITRVEFFSGSSSLGVDTTAPYSVNVTNASAGTYSLTARAWDNRGGFTTSAPVVVTVNAPPSVSVTAPTNGATYTPPATVTLAASASDADGTVASVEFFRNGTSLGVDTTAPYGVTWGSVAAGSYSLTARATDNRGAAATSAAVSITVSAPNAAPTVSLTAPAAGSVYTTPAAINLTATAADSDGTVSSVEFFRNGVSIGVDTTSPYGFYWTGVPAGTYSLTARATDNAGATATSAAVGVTVNAQPSAPRADTVGVYTNSTFQLRNSNTPGPSEVTTAYGMAGWTPVVGDWDGNGTTTLGVFNPNNGQGQSVFYLSNRTDHSYDDNTVVFGLPGDRPIAGDWDGNGTVTVGVYRPSNYTFYLRNTNSAGPADLVVTFTGYSGETPVAGDWDGDGVDTVGMHNASNATFYLRNANTSGPLNVVVGFGHFGDIPVVGDWDGDGKTTVGSYTGASATFNLRNQNTSGPADMAFQYGTAGSSFPVAGNWDGTRLPCCGDTVWFDDALPAGAVPAGNSETWTWLHSGPIPFSGPVAHQSAVVAGMHQHYFSAATQTLTVAAGEKLFAYVYLDPANPPSQVMLQWNEAGSWEHRAYWGANNLPWGVDGTASRRYVGPLPAAGQWVRLEVPASLVELEGRVLSGMAFSLFDGRATWDRAGKTTAAAPNVLISEFRFRGAGGASDEFVELYNNSDAPVTVCATDGSGGWALAASDGLARFTVPNGTVIPARGHYLATAGAYSLGAYAASDKPYSSEIADNTGVALFNTRNPFGFTSANRFDAAGFSTLANSLFFEGGGLSPLGAVNGEYSFVRRFAGAYPQDTNNNAADFAFISNTGDFFGGSLASMLGGAGPENLLSPLLRNGPIGVVLLDAAAASSVSPNRTRYQCDQTPDCNPASAPIGTLVVRRKIVNNTGVTLTGLRVRLMGFTTLNSPGYTNTGQADLRAINTADSNITLTDGTTILVKAAVLEQPPNQPVGGGYNSTYRIPLPAGGLPPGGTVNVQFALGLHRSGTFQFYFITEALP